uniref:Uncharacterized protein n=1 Tax=candidate division WOR-3 bacterium TaxID=2052148 RepID=A0A7C2P1Q7_UNCW3
MRRRETITFPAIPKLLKRNLETLVERLPESGMGKYREMVKRITKIAKSSNKNSLFALFKNTMNP